MLNSFDEMIDVLKALKDGKEIEMFFNGRWHKFIAPAPYLGEGLAVYPSFNTTKYRVKPEMKTIYRIRNNLGVHYFVENPSPGDTIIEKYLQVPLEE